MIKVYFGKDPGFSQHTALKDLKKSLSGPEYAQLVRLDGYKDPVSYIVESCQTISLFCPHKTVLVSNAYFFMETKSKKGSLKESDQNYEMLEHYLLNPSPETDLYFVVPGEISRTGSPNKALSSPMVTMVSCDLPSNDDYIMLAYSKAKEEHKDIDREAAALLLERTKGDYLAFVNNLDKLFTYTNKVMKTDVEELVHRPLEDNVFSIVSYLVKGRTKEAISAYEDLKNNGTDVLSLLPIFASQFNKMAMIRYLTDRDYKKEEIMKELKVSKGQVYYAQSDCKNLTFRTLIKIMNDLSLMEKDIKLNLDDSDNKMMLFLLLFQRNYLRQRY